VLNETRPVLPGQSSTFHILQFRNSTCPIHLDLLQRCISPFYMSICLALSRIRQMPSAVLYALVNYTKLGWFFYLSFIFIAIPFLYSSIRSHNRSPLFLIFHKSLITLFTLSTLFYLRAILLSKATIRNASPINFIFLFLFLILLFHFIFFQPI